MALTQYLETTLSRPCPKCGKVGWCAVHHSGRKCLCMRVQGGRPAMGGWIHYLPPGAAKPINLPSTPKVYLPPAQVQAYLDGTIGSCRDSMYAKLCQLLKLAPLSVWQMRATYDAKQAVLAFPMFDAEQQPTGIRFRRRDGSKWSLKGGREGVFMSVGFYPDSPVFVAEGPTDSAALIEAGFANVLGRPNCSGGVSIIQGLLREHRHTPVVILADPDEPGIAGAERLLLSLPNPAIVLSGPKDIRDFVTRFPKRADARLTILKVLTGYISDDWQIVAKNNAGHCFNFTEYFNVEFGSHDQAGTIQRGPERRDGVRPAYQISGGVRG